MRAKLYTFSSKQTSSYVPAYFWTLSQSLAQQTAMRLMIKKPLLISSILLLPFPLSHPLPYAICIGKDMSWDCISCAFLWLVIHTVPTEALFSISAPNFKVINLYKCLDSLNYIGTTYIHLFFVWAYIIQNWYAPAGHNIDVNSDREYCYWLNHANDCYIWAAL